MTADHLLICLAEECAEVAQRATKALRFGLGETQPGQPLTNAQRLHYELCDLLAVTDLLVEAVAIEGFESAEVRDAIGAKKAKIARYAKYSLSLGRSL